MKQDKHLPKPCIVQLGHLGMCNPSEMHEYYGENKDKPPKVHFRFTKNKTTSEILNQLIILCEDKTNQLKTQNQKIIEQLQKY